MQLKEKRSRTQEAKDIRRAQKEAVGTYTDRSASSTPVKLSGGRGGGPGRRPELVLEKGEVIDFSSLSSSDRTPLTSPSPSPSPDFSAPGTPASHSATPSLLSEADLIPDAMPPQALFHGEFITHLFSKTKHSSKLLLSVVFVNQSTTLNGSFPRHYYVVLACV